MSGQNDKRSWWAVAWVTTPGAFPAWVQAEDPAVAAARGVLERFIGPRTADWELARIHIRSPGPN